MTPAQASGRYDFVTDVPVQGPTDEGMRAADCWWTQNVLPVRTPACVDCKGPIPQWANRPTTWGGGWPEYGGNGGSNCGGGVNYGGRRVNGFSLADPSDPAATLTSYQQSWVINALSRLHMNIMAANPGTSCPTWQDPAMNLAAAVDCFQSWYNANAGGTLRNDGVLDTDTLCALIGTAATRTQDFPIPFPDPRPACMTPTTAGAPPVPPPAPVTAPAVAPAAPPAVPPPPPAPPPAIPALFTRHGVTISEPAGPTTKFGLSTGAMIGIGVAGAAVLGGIIYATTTTQGRRTRRR